MSRGRADALQKGGHATTNFKVVAGGDWGRNGGAMSNATCARHAAIYRSECLAEEQHGAAAAFRRGSVMVRDSMERLESKAGGVVHAIERAEKRKSVFGRGGAKASGGGRSAHVAGASCAPGGHSGSSFAGEGISPERLLAMEAQADGGHHEYFAAQPSAAAIALDRDSARGGIGLRSRHRGLMPIEMMPKGGGYAGGWLRAHSAAMTLERNTIKLVEVGGAVRAGERYMRLARL